jgi:c-di-GMP-related signal transduction protein
MPQPTPPTDDSTTASIDRTAIARQAIVDQTGAVFAYELFDRSLGVSGHSAASDAQLLFNVLSHADNSALIDNRLLFINCTHASLAGGHLDLIQPDRVVLEIPTLPGDDTEDIEARLGTLQDLRKRGFRLAFAHSALHPAYGQWLALASFIKIDLGQIPESNLAAVVQLAQRRSDARIVGEKVESQAQHDQLLALGVKLYQGYWFAKPVIVTGQTVRPGQAVIIQLINLVRKQATTAEIEEVLKRDASLSFNLLRFINSSGFGLSVEISSFRHAVMILGLKKLFRWAALLLTTSRAGGVPPAVGMTAVVRGRLMELLAAELLPPEECDNAFVTGVFSLLDTMLGMSMDKALEAVALPESVVSALLLRRGLLAPLLELTIACEMSDDQAFARLATELQLSDRQINLAHLQALAWAESLNDAE